MFLDDSQKYKKEFLMEVSWLKIPFFFPIDILNRQTRPLPEPR